MTNIAGGSLGAYGGSVGLQGQPNKGAVNPIAAIMQQSQPAHVRTAGSIFGSVTHGSLPLKQRAVTNIATQAMAGAQGTPPPQGGGISNVLAGNFGGLTAKDPANLNPVAAAGNMSKELGLAKELNKDQGATQTADEMMDKALNMKFMEDDGGALVA